MSIEVVSVRSAVVCFSEERHSDTGEGWLVDAKGVLYSDGSRAVHCHWAYPTWREAYVCLDELRGKMA